ncbi:MAG TPA: DUF1573 domain-containing protein [Chitinophagales bacterium]|nr:DUF1573 domain-containing protein [Chitinophagales bacterium]
MKKAILSIGLFVCVAVGAKAQETTTPNPVNPNAPKFQFEKEVIDYGTIEHNADGNREFKFTNVGKEPLIISNAVGSCGCTTPQWPKEPIKPGATGVIKVHYATDRVGAFEKTVTLTSNADVPSKVLRIKGVVNPDPAPAATPAPATEKH